MRGSRNAKRGVVSFVADDDLKEEILRVITERNRAEAEEEFEAWCEHLVALPANFELKPKDGEADIELQPLRWMDSGIDLIQSSKVIAHTQLANGVEGPALNSYFTYPVFQMATEIFIKGMWLCQYPDCRLLTSVSYVDPAKRQKYSDELRSLGHNLINIVKAVREISQYRDDAQTMRFLKIIEGVIRNYYFPLHESDERGSEWAHSRYPKRFYNDDAYEARADNFQRYPQQRMVAKLFQDAEQRIDRLWNLRVELSAK
jgi:hypothetical protein